MKWTNTKTGRPLSMNYNRMSAKLLAVSIIEKSKWTSFFMIKEVESRKETPFSVLFFKKIYNTKLPLISIRL